MVLLQIPSTLSLNIVLIFYDGKCVLHNFCFQLNGKKERTKKFCGSHDVNVATDSSLHHLHLDSELADNAFFEPGDELDVQISVSQLSEDVNLNFHIVFTPVLCTY